MAQKLNGEKKLCDRELLEKILSIVERQEKLPPPAHQGEHRLYDNKSLMAKLNIKDKYLKKLRDNGYLGYSREGDKYWYTQEDVDRLPDTKISMWNILRLLFFPLLLLQ